MTPRSRKQCRKAEMRAWFKRFVPTSDPDNPSTLPLPDKELFNVPVVPSPADSNVTEVRRHVGRGAERKELPISPLVATFERIDLSMNQQQLPNVDGMSEGRQTRSMTESQQHQPPLPLPFDNSSPIYGNPGYQWNYPQQPADFNHVADYEMSDSPERDDYDDDDYDPQGVQRSRPSRAVRRPTPPQSAASSSSQFSQRGVKKRKYTLKKDKEREDPEYREKRDKNNEAVRRSREKKEQEEREEMEKKEAMREIIKIFIQKEGPDESNRLAQSLSEIQTAVFQEIFQETFPRSRTRQFAALNSY